MNAALQWRQNEIGKWNSVYQRNGAYHMKVAVAIDSFKGNISSMEAGQACRDGILRVFPDADVIVRPLADGGIGMLQALGFSILNAGGIQVSHGAKGLSEIETIRTNHVPEALKNCSFRIACDASDPLCGQLGCSAIFGPQKGATKEMISRMDADLSHFAVLAKQINPKADPDSPGSGAAGGLGFAFRTFLNAVLEPGVKIVLQETHLEDAVRDSDFVITGEGRLDAQTIMGKAPSGVAEIAAKYHIPVIAFSGCAVEDAGVCNQKGITTYFPILRKIITSE